MKWLFIHSILSIFHCSFQEIVWKHRWVLELNGEVYGAYRDFVEERYSPYIESSLFFDEKTESY